MASSTRCLGKTQSGFVALLLAAALFGLLNLLANQQLKSIASGNGFSSNIRASINTEPRQNLTIEGDIIVDSGTCLIENVNLNVTGGIIASNDATVIIRDAGLLVTTQGLTTSRDSIVLSDTATLIVENATVVLPPAYFHEELGIAVGNEAVASISNSKLVSREAFIVSRQNSRTYINRSIIGNMTDFKVFTIIAEDNSTTRIQDSYLVSGEARGNSSILISSSTIYGTGLVVSENGLIEIQNSKVGSVGTIDLFFGTFEDNSELRILNSTVGDIRFGGSSLSVRDSTVDYRVWVSGNSTAWLTNVSVTRLQADRFSTTYLVNCYVEETSISHYATVYVGWHWPLFGLVTIPRNWLPIVQGIAILAAIILTVILIIFLERRWKKWVSQKPTRKAQPSDFDNVPLGQVQSSHSR